ncbi:hypothetical protein [Cohnella soli]|uniref:DUF2207 domain-containing protein n=1 Tax=Cohnella soli TaxID=425005 RepID=A0ABW0HKV7_9BACL
MRDETVKTYTIAVGWKALIFGGVLLFIALSVYIGCVPFLDHLKIVPTVLCLLVSTALLILFIFAMVYLFKYKVTICEDALVIRKLRGELRVSLASITGYRYVYKSGYWIYLTERKKKIVITEYLSKLDNFEQWLAVGYKNLDYEEAKVESEKFLQGLEGTQDRDYTLHFIHKVKSFSKVLNILGVISFTWIFIYPIYYEMAICINAIIVLFAILTALIYYRYIDIDSKSNSFVKSNVALALIFPSLGLAIRSLLDYNLIYSPNVWIYAATPTMVVIILFFVRSKEGIKNKLQLLLFVPVFFAYSYGVVIQANCLLDRAEPEQYSVVVIDKRISSAKVTEYYLKVGPWGPFTKDNEISVSRDVYDSVEANEQVGTYIMPGRLKIPWFGTW